MKALLMDTGTAYNKNVVGTLVSIVPHYPVGVYVKIKYIIDDSLIGYRGVVAKVNPEHLNRPTIILLHDKAKRRITPRIVDTSKLKQLELEMVL